jgi:fructosamine-3-kinase
MSITSEIKNQIESFVNDQILSDNSVGGGCIADARYIKTESGHTYFLKIHSGKPNMFLTEANGLYELAKSNCLRIPKVVLVDDNFLLLEYIEQGAKPSNFFNDFGKVFAQMHRYTSRHFGFFEDNYIGASPQLNRVQGTAKTNWAEFYFQYRLLPQLKMAEKNGEATRELSVGIYALENKLENILQGSEEPPTLLHGDLWGGNYLCDNAGKPVLIDPGRGAGGARQRRQHLASRATRGGPAANARRRGVAFRVSGLWQERGEADGRELLRRCRDRVPLAHRRCEDLCEPGRSRR